MLKKALYFWMTSLSLGAFGTCWTCPSSDLLLRFLMFGSESYFLTYFPDDSTWFCIEELKPQCFSIKKHSICLKTDLDPKKSERNPGKIPFHGAPLRGPS